MTLRYEGVRFSDGSIAVRRVSADPCERSTTTFEGMRELEEDIGSADVTWIADHAIGSPTSLRSVPCLDGCTCPRHIYEKPPASEPTKVQPKLVFGPVIGGAAPPPVEVKTAEDWRKHIGGTPPEWFTNPAPPSVIRRVDEFAVPLRPVVGDLGGIAMPLGIVTRCSDEEVAEAKAVLCQKGYSVEESDAGVDALLGPRSLYVGDDYPRVALRRARYEPTEETDEP